MFLYLFKNPSVLRRVFINILNVCYTIIIIKILAEQCFCNTLRSYNTSYFEKLDSLLSIKVRTKVRFYFKPGNFLKWDWT